MTKPPALPKKEEAPGDSEAMDRYNTIAETVGGIPSLRMKDNLPQGLSILATTLVGAAIGWFLYGGMGGLLLAVGGMIVGLLVSGIVLMVLGWIRALKGTSGNPSTDDRR